MENCDQKMDEEGSRRRAKSNTEANQEEVK